MGMRRDVDDEEIWQMVPERPKPIITSSSGEIDGDRLIWITMSACSFALRIMAIIGFALSLIDVVPYIWILPIKAMTLLILVKFIDYTRQDLMIKANEDKLLENKNG